MEKCNRKPKEIQESFEEPFDTAQMSLAADNPCFPFEVKADVPVFFYTNLLHFAPQTPKAEQGNFIIYPLEITRSLIRSQVQGKHRNTLEDADISDNFYSKLGILRI